MRVLVVGCGSIGTRRAEILSDMGHDVAGYDTNEKTMREWPYRASVPAGWADVALICTPPDVRLSVVGSLTAYGIEGLFIEKPVALDHEELEAILELIDDAVPVTMGACNMRFDSRLVDFVATKSVFAEMGQHSKHWSGNHEPISLILDSIHELDLLRHFAGPLSGIEGESTLQRSDVATTHYSGIVGGLHLNRFTDPPERFIGIDHRIINLWPPDPDMYLREMEHFMECVEKGEPTCNPIEDAAELLRWALQVVDE